MKTLQAKTTWGFKRHGPRFWLSRFALLIGLGVLFYYGYCWGLWGRSSLLLQYVFQCSCPATSAEARYPEQVDVIISACRYLNITLLPGGRYLHVRERRFWSTSTYLLDLQTNEKSSINLPDNAHVYFLTDDLVYVSSSDEYILDWINEKQYPIRKFVFLKPDAYVDGHVNLELLADALHKAERIFLINDDMVVALATNFPASSDHNFLTGWYDIPGFDPNRVEEFLRENNIVYESITENFPDEAASPDGRFIARNDGIYLIETGQKIVDAYPSRVRGWASDGRGVIYSSSGPCLIRTNFGFLDDFVCFFEVPQPVLLLKVPEEYLLPAQTP
jgi:hypothetical protein